MLRALFWNVGNVLLGLQEIYDAECVRERMLRYLLRKVGLHSRYPFSL